MWNVFGVVWVERDERGRLKTWKKIEPRPLFFWRASVTLNFVVSGAYKSAILQRWYYSKENAEMDIPEMQRELLQRVEDYLGYRASEWWFPVIVGKAVQTSVEWGTEYFDVREI